MSKGQVETRTPIVVGGTTGAIGGAVQTTLRDGAKGLEDNLKTGLGDAEKAVQHAGDVAADVVTAGGHGRERDEREAEHQRELARQAEAAAAAKLAVAREAKRNEIASLEAKLQDLQSRRADLEVLRPQVEKNTQLTAALIRDQMASKMQADTIQQLIDSQLRDLVEWATSSDLPGSEGTSSAAAVRPRGKDLAKRIAIYRDQISNVPNPIDPSNTLLKFEDVLSAGLEVLEQVDAAITATNVQIETTKQDKIEKQDELAKLG